MEYEGFPEIFERGVGHAMAHELTILGCTSGHHRSVAVGEIIARHLDCCRMQKLDIGIIHVGIDAGGKDIQWLLNWKS